MGDTGKSSPISPASCVYHWWYDSGMTQKRFDDATELEIAGRYAAGENCQKLAKMYHCHWGVILRAVRNQGGTVRKGGARRLGPDHPRWKGVPIRQQSKKYLMIWVSPDDPLNVMTHVRTNYAFEHRIVMARAVGRPLTPNETVHHINGDWTDNRLENLQLRSGRHGRGQVACWADCGASNFRFMPLAG